MSVPPRRTVPALLQIDAILHRLGGASALAEVCRFLRQEFAHFAWIGVYRVEGTELVLDGWDGERPTEHTRIPIARGLCGRAAREGRSVIVEDVTAAPEYLACFRETRSEIVVPIRRDGAVIGEIDVDGNVRAAFDASDEQLLSEVARRIAGAVGAAPAGGATGATGPASPGAPP